VAGTAIALSDAFRLVCLNATLFAAGAAVLVVLAGFPVSRRWLPTLLGLMPATGIAVCGLAATMTAMVGIDVGIVSTVLVVVAAVLAQPLLIRRAPGMGSLEPTRSGPAARVVELVCLVVLGLLCLEVVRLTAASHLDQWDGWAMWAPKAHALFAEGDVWGPVFTQPEYGMQHQEYPILFPAIEALSAEAVGRFDADLIDFQAGVVLLSFGLATWGVLRLVVNPAVAAAAAVALTGSPALILNAAGNYADSVVAAFTALGLLTLPVWLLHGAGSMLVLSALFLSAACMTKVEGLLFALAAVATAAVTARGFGRSTRTALVFGAAVLAAPAAWMVVDRLNGAGGDNVNGSLLLDPAALLAASDRIPTAAGAMIEHIGEGWPMASLLGIVGIAAACAARLWWPALVVGLWVGLAFAALVGVYLFSTSPIEWLVATSADRVVFSLVVGAATMAPVLVSLAYDRVRRPESVAEVSLLLPAALVPDPPPGATPVGSIPAGAGEALVQIDS
jgi:hypothetical protein